MSKKNKVINLSELTLSSLANSIVSAVVLAIAQENIETNFNLTELDMSLVMVEINSYLEANGATHTIYQEILQSILSSENLQASIRFVCLQMLLNENTRSLKTEVFPYPYYEKVRMDIFILIPLTHTLTKLSQNSRYYK
jgi:ABC-type proline/glycine betaine transport system permease subunit